jgi:hypothetical protein
MARKVMKVEGMTDAEVLVMLNESVELIVDARRKISMVAGAFSNRDLHSVKVHLDKAVDIIQKRGDIVEKKVNSYENAEERKKTEKAMKEALKDPEKAAALKALLNL